MQEPAYASPEIDRVTQLLAHVAAGEANAEEQLIHAVYDELRQLAAARLRRERADHTLSSTALVHEAYLRLLHGDAPLVVQNRRHFFTAAAEAMRRILIEHARRRAANKRAGVREEIRLESDLIDTSGPDADVLAVDEAIAALERHDRLAAQLVKLRYFGGLTHAEAAEHLEITRRQADRLWAIARAYLFRRLKDAP